MLINFDNLELILIRSVNFQIHSFINDYFIFSFSLQSLEDGLFSVPIIFAIYEWHRVYHD